MSVQISQQSIWWLLAYLRLELSGEPTDRQADIAIPLAWLNTG